MASLLDPCSHAMPFHIVVEGTCWLRMDGGKIDSRGGRCRRVPVRQARMSLGAGAGGRLINPIKDLPPKPWREVPILRYRRGVGPRVRLLVRLSAVRRDEFRPLRSALPTLLHARTEGANGADWLARNDQADRGRSGQAARRRAFDAGTADRDHVHRAAAPSDRAGERAVGRMDRGAADPSLGRCLALIHDDPRREWSVQELAAAAGLSRSTLTERFETMLATSPMRYVRDWRLYWRASR